MTVPHLGTVSVQAKSFPDKRVSKKKRKKKKNSIATTSPVWLFYKKEKGTKRSEKKVTALPLETE